MTDKSIFDDFAEKKIGGMAQEHEQLLNQLHKIDWAILEMSKDKRMTNAAWQRVMKQVQNMRLRAEDQQDFKLNELEKAMAKNLRNQMGIAVQMAIKSEDILNQVKKEMAAAQKIAMDKQKEALEADKLQIEPVVQEEGNKNEQ